MLPPSAEDRRAPRRRAGLLAIASGLLLVACPSEGPVYRPDPDPGPPPAANTRPSPPAPSRTAAGAAARQAISTAATGRRPA